MRTVVVCCVFIRRFGSGRLRVFGSIGMHAPKMKACAHLSLTFRACIHTHLCGERSACFIKGVLCGSHDNRVYHYSAVVRFAYVHSLLWNKLFTVSSMYALSSQAQALGPFPLLYLRRSSYQETLSISNARSGRPRLTRSM